MCNGEIFPNKTKGLEIPNKTIHFYRYLPKQETTKWQDKNYFKTKTVESENVESCNKFQILEKMERKNSLQVHKHKGHKNKRSNSPDLRPNNEPQNNPVELPRNQS